MGNSETNAAVNELELEYALDTTHLIIQAGDSELSRTRASSSYWHIVATNGFFERLDKIKRSVNNIEDQYMIVSPSVRISGDYGFCAECQIDMTIEPERSEFVCTGCGEAKSLIGTVFEDAQFYNQEGQKTISGSISTNRHYLGWMTHIFALESIEELSMDDGTDECGETLLKSLRNIITTDQIMLQTIGIDWVRKSLKHLNRTCNNRNIPLIIKLLTGVGPPRLSYELRSEVDDKFKRAIEIASRQKMDGANHRKYYPFYIYKILDALIPHIDRETRKIFRFIYLQGDETVTSGDNNWEKICRELDGIEYRATDRTQGCTYA
jgi:hypothetical protein